MPGASYGQKGIVIGTAIFACGILLVTKLDHIVNSTLYGQGTSFSMSWYWPYSVVYFLLLQGFVAVLFLFVRRKEAVLLAEAFILSGSQDIVYFGVWNGGVFPPGQWSWTPYFWAFGGWNTVDQLALSAASLGLACVIIVALRWRTAKAREKPARR